MSDDETKKDETTDETPQDEGTGAAGPVSDTSSSPTGEDPASSPPAADASEDEGQADEAADEAAPEEEAAEAAPAAEAEAEPNPEDDLPWKERRRLAKSRRQPRKAGPSGPDERKAARQEARERKATLRRKQRAAAKAAHTAGTGTATPPAARAANAAKVRQGIVVSSKGDKSITVRIDIARRHRTYEKIVRSSTKLHAHDERNEAGEGDVVRVIETRPLSKTKRWRLVDVVEKAR
jgi:small subunit ribosomal protein S17